MYAVIVTIEVRPGALKTFMPLMCANAATSLKQEAGCRQFDIATDPDRPDEVFLFELYEDRAAFDLHLSSNHFRDFDAATANLTERKTVRTYREVIQ